MTVLTLTGEMTRRRCGPFSHDSVSFETEHTTMQIALTPQVKLFVESFWYFHKPGDP